MKVLITGAAGFIGMNLALHLKNQGIDVLGIDCFTPYYSLTLKETRAQMLQLAGIELRREDIAHPGILKKAIEEFAPTHLVHLAAQAGVRHSLTDPHSYITANIFGFLEVLEAGRAFPHIPIVWASSSSVYGTNTKIPFKETDPTDCPANLYGATKKSNEVMAYSYHHLFGLHLTGLRFFTVYGPWGRPDMAYFRFAQQITHGEEILLFGNGMQRDFTYIDDIVRGIVAALSYKKKWSIFNLGGSCPEPVEKLISLLEKNLQRKANIRIIEPQPGDILTTYADATFLTQELGVKPYVSLEEGIGLFCQWFQKYSKNCLAK